MLEEPNECYLAVIGEEGNHTTGKIISAPWGIEIGKPATIEAQDENGMKFEKTGYIAAIRY